MKDGRAQAIDSWRLGVGHGQRGGTSELMYDTVKYCMVKRATYLAWMGTNVIDISSLSCGTTLVSIVRLFRVGVGVVGYSHINSIRSHLNIASTE